VKHKNSLLLLLGILLAFFFSSNSAFRGFLLGLGSFGYLGAFLAGIFFVSTFTITIGALIILTLAKTLSPAGLIVAAGLGAVIGDLLIFRFVKDDVAAEITPIYDQITGNHFRKIFHTRYFAWTLPVVGALIIISPLPDELGVSLLGLSEVKIYKFLLISSASHAVGMLLLVSAALLAP